MKSILFSTEMVRAILDGRKTVTRRVVKLKYDNTHLEMYTNKYGTRLIEKQNEEPGVTTIRNPDGTTTHRLLAAIEKTPPYRPGDVLYVRETWCESLGEKGVYFYRAYAGPRDEMKEYCHSFNTWHPSIHMPREAARIFLRVTDVSVERLQAITEEQARAEGTEPFALPVDPEDTPYNERTWVEMGPALPHFISLWDSTIKPADRDKYGWGANPYCWVIEFERITKEEAINNETLLH